MAFFSRIMESLKKTADFRNVYQNGKSLANKYLVMYVMENNREKNRLGISVSKKVGNSVVRHRVTRLIRESYRLHENIFNSGLDIVVIARICAADFYHKNLSKICIPSEKNKMSLFSLLFSIWVGGS